MLDGRIWLTGLPLLLLGCTQDETPTEGVMPFGQGDIEEVAEKEQRIRRFLKEQGLDGVLISTQRNFAWITGGGDNHVVITSRLGVVSLLIGRQGQYLITPNNEKTRYLDQELKGLGYEPLVYAWHEDVAEGRKQKLIEEFISRGWKIGSDVPFPGTQLVDKELVRLQVPLTDQEIGRYRWLGRKCTEVIQEICREIKPGMTEEEIRGEVAGRLWRWGITPTVLLIGVDEGILKYRHVIPKGRQLRKYAQINICGRKWGLVVAVTRLVHFGPLPKEIRKRQDVAARVYATFLVNTRPGVPVARIFEKALQAYAKAGYPDEWMNHHQGGAIGYQERDYIAYPGCPQVVQVRQAFAWNPTLEGAKAEDTFLVFKKGQEVITRAPDWPYQKVEVEGQVVEVPDILIR